MVGFEGEQQNLNLLNKEPLKLDKEGHHVVSEDCETDGPCSRAIVNTRFCLICGPEKRGGQS